MNAEALMCTQFGGGGFGMHDINNDWEEVSDNDSFPSMGCSIEGESFRFRNRETGEVIRVEFNHTVCAHNGSPLEQARDKIRNGDYTSLNGDNHHRDNFRGGKW